MTNVCLKLYLYETKQQKQNVMKPFILNSYHKGTLIDQAIRLKSSIQYYNDIIVPSIEEIDSYEFNEFTMIYNNNVKKLEKLKKEIMKNQAIFNEMLFEYGISSVVFIAKYL